MSNQERTGNRGDIIGTPDDDALDGTRCDDTILGGAGDDRIDGRAGNDVLKGEAGDDTLIGGAGNDTLFGGDGDDLLEGGEGNDMLKGEGGNDTLIGGDGRDKLFGGDGDDRLEGGAGNDELHGDAGDDTLIGGAGDDLVFGGDGDDRLEGGDGNDTLKGGAGNDTIIGGAGHDLMKGEGGDDTFFGGPGDTVHGGDGFDTLDIVEHWGNERIVITDEITNDDGSVSQDGYVEFLDGSPNLEFTSIERIISCFTPGTRIATPEGERLAETLREGDKIITRDNGIQEIRWAGKRKMDWQSLQAHDHLKPILIEKGSLGNDLPERDMLVSPQHRLLVANERTALYFEEHEVLVAAKHLINGRSIREVDSLGVTYVHFMCDRHEVVLSDGAWTETFQPGDYTLMGMGNAQRLELYQLFPDLQTQEGREAYGAARKTLKRHEARLLAS